MICPTCHRPEACDSSRNCPHALGEEIVAKLREADEATSVVHDYLCGLNGVSPDDCEEAVWKIHNTLRPLIDPTGEEWLRLRAETDPG